MDITARELKELDKKNILAVCRDDAWIDPRHLLE